VRIWATPIHRPLLPHTGFLDAGNTGHQRRRYAMRECRVYHQNAKGRLRTRYARFEITLRNDPKGF
jgi:hypothetical protein